MAQAPTITIASTPSALPATAKRELDSASVSIPVSGLRPTTANFADVVSGVPTSGEKANTTGAAGASGSTPTGASRHRSQLPSPTPPT